MTQKYTEEEGGEKREREREREASEKKKRGESSEVRDGASFPGWITNGAMERPRKQNKKSEKVSRPHNRKRETSKKYSERKQCWQTWEDRRDRQRELALHT